MGEVGAGKSTVRLSLVRGHGHGVEAQSSLSTRRLAKLLPKLAMI